MALSGFIVQLDRSVGPLSSVLEASEVKAGNDAVDELNKTLFLPSLNTSRRDDAENGLRKNGSAIVETSTSYFITEGKNAGSLRARNGDLKLEDKTGQTGKTGGDPHGFWDIFRETKSHS